MRERFVRFGHTMDVFTLGVSDALLVVRVEEFVGELLRGRLALFIAHGHEDPADAQGLGAVRLDRHRNLIGRAADALGANFDGGLDVVQRGFEDFQRRNVRNLFGEDFKRFVNDLTGGVLFAVPHQAVGEFADKKGIVKGIACQLFFAGGNTTHCSILSSFGMLRARAALSNAETRVD